MVVGCNMISAEVLVQLYAGVLAHAVLLLAVIEYEEAVLDIIERDRPERYCRPIPAWTCE